MRRTVARPLAAVAWAAWAWAVVLGAAGCARTLQGAADTAPGMCAVEEDSAALGTVGREGERFDGEALAECNDDCDWNWGVCRGSGGREQACASERAACKEGCEEGVAATRARATGWQGPAHEGTDRETTATSFAGCKRACGTHWRRCGSEGTPNRTCRSRRSACEMDCAERFDRRPRSEKVAATCGSFCGEFLGEFIRSVVCP